MTSSNGNIFRVTGRLCGEFTGPGEFPTQRPVTWSFDVFFDLRLNKRLSKQPWGWWFETPSWSLWRHKSDVGRNNPSYNHPIFHLPHPPQPSTVQTTYPFFRLHIRALPSVALAHGGENNGWVLICSLQNGIFLLGDSREMTHRITSKFCDDKKYTLLYIM